MVKFVNVAVDAATCPRGQASMESLALLNLATSARSLAPQADLPNCGKSVDMTAARAESFKSREALGVYVDASPACGSS